MPDPVVGWDRDPVMAGDWYPNEDAPDASLSGQIASAQNAGVASHPGRPSAAPDSAI